MQSSSQLLQSFHGDFNTKSSYWDVLRPKCSPLDYISQDIS